MFDFLLALLALVSPAQAEASNLGEPPRPPACGAISEHNYLCQSQDDRANGELPQPPDCDAISPFPFLCKLEDY